MGGNWGKVEMFVIKVVMLKLNLWRNTSWWKKPTLRYSVSGFLWSLRSMMSILYMHSFPS